MTDKVSEEAIPSIIASKIHWNKPKHRRKRRVQGKFKITYKREENTRRWEGISWMDKINTILLKASYRFNTILLKAFYRFNKSQSKLQRYSS